MTTKVTVDAHAGWPVEVTTIDLGSDGTPNLETKRTVPANTVEDFYIHDTREVRVKELKKAS